MSKLAEHEPDGCAAHGCAKPAKSKGYCWSHYHKAKRYGDPLWEREQGPSAFDVLRPVIGSELAHAVVQERALRKSEKRFDAYRAKITLAMFQRASDPKLSAWEYVHREENKKRLTQEYLRPCVQYEPDCPARPGMRVTS